MLNISLTLCKGGDYEAAHIMLMEKMVSKAGCRRQWLIAELADFVHLAIFVLGVGLRILVQGAVALLLLHLLLLHLLHVEEDQVQLHQLGKSKFRKTATKNEKCQDKQRPGLADRVCIFDKEISARGPGSRARASKKLRTFIHVYYLEDLEEYRIVFFSEPHSTWRTRLHWRHGRRWTMMSRWTPVNHSLKIKRQDDFRNLRIQMQEKRKLWEW